VKKRERERKLEKGIPYWELGKLRKTCQGRFQKCSISLFSEAPVQEPGGKAPTLRTPRDI